MVGFVSNLFGSTFSYVMSPIINSTVTRAVTLEVMFASTTMLNDEDYRYILELLVASTNLPSCFLHKNQDTFYYLSSTSYL